VVTSVATELTGLQPGTTYHFRLIATNASGTSAGSDLTLTTGGIAPPPGASLTAVTGIATQVDAHDATPNGTITASGSTAGSAVRYYFQLGAQLYELETLGQTFRASSMTVPVYARLTGLQSDRLYHYRLIAVTDDGVASAGSDRTFSTAPTTRLNPLAVQAFASPVSQRRLPDTVTVSGRLLPPSSLDSALACHGFVDITFRVRTVAIQLLRAGLHGDCTFSLPVRFSVRRRLRGGHVQVHVLFPGNQFLNRLEAPVQTIQIG
jgi:phosphodiesterase/alkaline phosphatase D-like protein